MHWHVDWEGLGNLRSHERREHLVALFVMFGRLLAETADWPVPHQDRQIREANLASPGGRDDGYDVPAVA